MRHVGLSASAELLVVCCCWWWRWRWRRKICFDYAKWRWKWNWYLTGSRRNTRWRGIITRWRGIITWLRPLPIPTDICVYHNTLSRLFNNYVTITSFDAKSEQFDSVAKNRTHRINYQFMLVDFFGGFLSGEFFSYLFHFRRIFGQRLFLGEGGKIRPLRVYIGWARTDVFNSYSTMSLLSWLLSLRFRVIVSVHLRRSTASFGINSN